MIRLGNRKQKKMKEVKEAWDNPDLNTIQPPDQPSQDLRDPRKSLEDLENLPDKVLDKTLDVSTAQVLPDQPEITSEKIPFPSEFRYINLGASPLLIVFFNILKKQIKDGWSSTYYSVHYFCV